MSERTSAGDPLLFAPLRERRRLLDERGLGADELHRLRDDWIREQDPDLRAFAEWRPAASSNGSRPAPPLTVTYKDLIDVAGWATRCGSRHGFRYYPRRSARVVSLLEGETTTSGKVETTEFGVGNWFPCVNPAAREFSPGGSSTGSAVAVAAGFCDLSVGTDTSGSVRLPATNCGVVGLRLTPVPELLEGVVPVSPSLDSLGLVARTVDDLDHVWHDRALARLRRAVGADRNAQSRPLRLRLATSWREEPCDEPVVAAFDRLVDRLSDRGVPLEPATVAWWRYRDAVWPLVLRELADAHDELRRTHTIEYSESVEALLEAGGAISRRDYAAVRRDQDAAVAAAEAQLGGSEALLLPLDPVLPRHLSVPPPSTTVPMARSASSTWGNALGFAELAGVARLPALALVAGHAPNGAPVGVQLLGAPGSEDGLIAAGRMLERTLDRAEALTAA